MPFLESKGPGEAIPNPIISEFFILLSEIIVLIWFVIAWITSSLSL